jgi:uncharacterized membrane protein
MMWKGRAREMLMTEVVGHWVEVEDWEARALRAEARVTELLNKLATLRALVNVWQKREETIKGNAAHNASEMQEYLREETIEQTG